MNQYFNIAIRSILNRLYPSTLTTLSIALSLVLLLTVNQVRRGSEESFTQAISQTDLIVGARSGPMNLLLFTIFNIGAPSNNISVESYENFKNKPEIEWTIPISLGDGHRGFRVVATNESFYKNYRFRYDKSLRFSQGSHTGGLWDAVLGSTVAKQLNYKIGDKVSVAHGTSKGDGIILHDDKAFNVSGILEATGTVLDHSLYIELESMEALHLDWVNGAVPTKDKVIPQSAIKKSDLKVNQISAFLLRTKSRIEVLRLQREINTYTEEPLSAIIPGVTLSELWRNLDYIDLSLKTISWMVVLVGVLSLVIAILSSLNERRREMAIMRSLGARPTFVSFLLIIESLFVTTAGVLFGLVFQYFVFLMASQILMKNFGVYISSDWMTSSELIIVIITWLLGSLSGLLPAYSAYNITLKDGLCIKT